jgi:hypothetical protein
VPAIQSFEYQANVDDGLPGITGNIDATIRPAAVHVAADRSVIARDIE